MNITLCPEVTGLLERSTITDDLLILPEGQLDRKLYEKVAKAIKLSGGKWNRSKAGFVFASDPRAKLGLALEKGTIIDEKKLLQAFYTPDELAAEVASMADVEGRTVLEPSAGNGALVFACLGHGAQHVDAIEINSECVPHVSGTDITLLIQDFLTVTPDPCYERIVMNPPFSKGQALKHIEHAKKFLSMDGQLYSIVLNQECDKLKSLGAVTLMEFEEGAFKKSGTNVVTRLIRITQNN